MPFIPGHEIISVVEEIGDKVSKVKPGQRVGIGWFSNSCMHCEWCESGNLCPEIEHLVVHGRGGFADRMRINENWAVTLPKGIPPDSAGPLFCGGVTVFNPIVQFGILAKERVGVIDVGGLGHLAIKFLNAWGCEVTAFSSNPGKE
jgi:uncharacterized zinc-type alcohol dehydrogenase-like protein